MKKLSTKISVNYLKGTNMYSYCCVSMKNHCSEDRVTEKSIIYIKRRKQYGIPYFDKQSYNEIYYCPWCGKQITKMKYVHSKLLSKKNGSR